MKYIFWDVNGTQRRITQDDRRREQCVSMYGGWLSNAMRNNNNNNNRRREKNDWRKCKMFGKKVCNLTMIWNHKQMAVLVTHNIHTQAAERRQSEMSQTKWE